MTSAASRTSLAHVRARLAAYSPASLPVSTWRQAAVLVALRPIVGDRALAAGEGSSAILQMSGGEGSSAILQMPGGEGSSDVLQDAELEVIFTRRTASLSKHSGQVAFPGGSIDAGDATAEAAALREAHEELAIPASAVTVIGRLDDVLSNSGFHVTPVVGLVAPRVVLTPAAAEVARVFTVPLADLADTTRWELVPFMRGERRFDLPHFYSDGEDIWGLTALMLMRLLELL